MKPSYVWSEGKQQQAVAGSKCRAKWYQWIDKMQSAEKFCGILRSSFSLLSLSLIMRTITYWSLKGWCVHISWHRDDDFHIVGDGAWLELTFCFYHILDTAVAVGLNHCLHPYQRLHWSYKKWMKGKCKYNELSDIGISNWRMTHWT